MHTAMNVRIVWKTYLGNIFIKCTRLNLKLTFSDRCFIVFLDEKPNCYHRLITKQKKDKIMKFSS